MTLILVAIKQNLPFKKLYAVEIRASRTAHIFRTGSFDSSSYTETLRYPVLGIHAPVLLASGKDLAVVK